MKKVSLLAIPNIQAKRGINIVNNDLHKNSGKDESFRSIFQRLSCVSELTQYFSEQIVWLW